MSAYHWSLSVTVVPLVGWSVIWHWMFAVPPDAVLASRTSIFPETM
jgi:hypothetical protein